MTLCARPSHQQHTRNSALRCCLLLHTTADHTPPPADSGFDASHPSLQGVDLMGGFPVGYDTDVCGHGSHVSGTISARGRCVLVYVARPTSRRASALCVGLPHCARACVLCAACGSCCTPLCAQQLRAHSTANAPPSHAHTPPTLLTPRTRPTRWHTHTRARAQARAAARRGRRAEWPRRGRVHDQGLQPQRQRRVRLGAGVHADRRHAELYGHGRQGRVHEPGRHRQPHHRGHADQLHVQHCQDARVRGRRQLRQRHDAVSCRWVAARAVGAAWLRRALQTAERQGEAWCRAGTSPPLA
jgi:hypothetical protein